MYVLRPMYVLASQVCSHSLSNNNLSLQHEQSSFLVKNIEIIILYTGTSLLRMCLGGHFMTKDLRAGVDTSSKLYAAGNRQATSVFK